MSHPCIICGKPAMGPYSVRSFCALHVPSSPLPLSVVTNARQCMASGSSLKQTAELLGVMSSDLDQALWAWFGVRNHAPVTMDGVA